MQEYNFSYLLVALLFFVIGIPIINDLALLSMGASRLLGITCLLAIGIWSLRGNQRLFSTGMLVAIAGIILNVISVARDDETLHIISLLVLFIFLLLAGFNTLRHIAVGNDINPNRIVGAVCVYLLLGVMWAVVYAVIEYWQPGSFKGLSAVGPQALNTEWVYYSFVTITTLGYGDITPLSQTAKSFAFAEAIAGQFYIAVLVAGLVSAYISAKQSGDDGS